MIELLSYRAMQLALVGQDTLRRAHQTGPSAASVWCPAFRLSGGLKKTRANCIGQKCNYPKAFRQYRLSLDYDTVITVNDVNTNSVTGHFGVLGKERYFQLEVLPKNQFSSLLHTDI